MRVCVSHVYWMLLLTSVVSSALLFLIVASENIQHSKFIGPDNQALAQEEETVTFIKNSQEQPDLSDSETNSSPKDSFSSKSKKKEQNSENFQDPISASFDIASKNEELKIPDEIEILKESLTQQPNLSQGVSDGGQAVVLTLVQDTATTNLQSLAAGRSEFRPKAEGNASSGPKDDSLVRISKLFNGANVSNESFYEDDSVVVVRAEQRSVKDDAEDKKEEDAKTEQNEPEEKASVIQEIPVEATSDLNDSEARARITNGAADESTVAILDSLVTAGPSEPAHEDIPSFNEWAQKRLEEAEKKKTHSNASVQTANGSPARSASNMRMRSKNYASPDCGAKIVAANPESRSTRSILVSTRDEYMLNTCGSRIWFIVELCEAIQVKKIELANFELFSSSPKDLSVYVSDRYPSREWSNVGQFTARDERDVQSFSLHPQIFGKFIKVELSSHYGSEHFCPISLFRAYGTSEFEVLETETENDHLDVDLTKEVSSGNIAAGSIFEGEDDYDEDGLFPDEEETRGEPPVHIFGSARDAVLSLVKKAAEVLLKSADLKPTNNITKIQESIKGDILQDTTLDDCVTPMYSVACRDCDDNRFARVFQLISCKGHYLESLLNTDFVQKTLSKSLLCGSSFGFDYVFDSEACSDGVKASNDRSKDISSYYIQAHFLSSFFTPDYIIALCNVLAAREQRLFANVSHQEQKQLAEITASNKTRIEQTGSLVSLTKTTKDDKVTPTQVSDLRSSDITKAKAETPVIKSKLESATESQVISESLITQIKPTKTTSLKEELRKPPLSTNLESSRSIGLVDTPHQSETSISDPSTVSVATKTSSQKIISGSKERGHDELPKRDTTSSGPISKASSSIDSQQKPTEKNVGPESGSEIKTKNEEEKAERAKVEPAEPDLKTQTQDQNLNLEFDFKDLDVDTLQNNAGSKGDASFTQQTASATTPQQKESVFLRLSNRIKVLERNMSLSSQYLEELSKRYKKQVEEMQRSLERAMTAMTEASRKNEEREIKRLEEMSTLRSQIENLNQALDGLVHERNSWRISLSSLFQHTLFVFVDVVLVVLIFSYCRRTDDDLDYYEEVLPERRRVVVKPRIGKTYEMVKQSCNQLTKKPKKRRPSEIASQVSGTYDQLMIENTANQLSKKDRRKKRKKDSTILRTASTASTKENNSVGKGAISLKVPPMHSRSASASDAYYHGKTNEGLPNLELQKHNRPESAPDNSIEYFANQPKQQQPRFDKRVQILAMSERENDNEVVANNPEDLNVSLEDDTFGQESSPGSTCTPPKVVSVPLFMKTALGSRSKRISFSGRKLSQNFGENKTDSEVELYSESETVPASGDSSVNNALLTPTNGHAIDESEDDSRCSSATPTSWSSKKDKKTNGLKRVVRKFLRLN